MSSRKLHVVCDPRERVIQAARSLMDTLNYLRIDPHQQGTTVRELNLGGWANLLELESALANLDSGTSL